MQSQHASLWLKIESFELDEPLINYPFSKKLATENNWSESFTKKAILEYKKFILLSCISASGASPSPIVDKVWHLHLTYTTSYWDDFCKKTLQKNIHHYPSKGGIEEIEKHNKCYNDTLNFYQETFNEIPPLDIWPLFANQNIDSDKLNFNIKVDKITIAFCFLLIALAFILSAIFFNKINPFLLRGIDFLAFYACLFTLAIIALIIFAFERQRQIKIIINKYFPSNYNLFQAVYFLYGKNRAFQTALVHLFIKGIFELNGKRFKYNAKNALNETNQNPLYPAILELEDDTSLFYKEVEAQLYNENTFTHPIFLKFEKIFKLKSKFPNYLLVSIIFIGIARIFQGWANEKPVGFLFIEIILFTIIYRIIYININEAAIILKSSLNKIKADGFKEIETENGTLQQFAQHGNEALHGFSEYAVLASIFIAYPINNPNNSYVAGGNWDSGGDSGGSSCGSDGGGSSCGGGGCGGCSGGGD